MADAVEGIAGTRSGRGRGGVLQHIANAHWSTDVRDPQWTNDEDSERRQIKFSLRKNLSDRYNKWACISLGYNGNPVSCGFSELRRKDPSVLEEFPVRFLFHWQPSEIFKECYSFWLKLDEKGQDVLYTLLGAAATIKKEIYYDAKKLVWLPKSSSQDIPARCTYLSDYGPMRDMEIPGTVLDHLARGRSAKDLEKMMENPLYSELKERLVDSWGAAFIASMTDGEAHIAVIGLFEALFHVLGKGFPPLVILNITSSLKADRFKISSSSSSQSSDAPAAKRRKRDDQADQANQAEEKDKVEIWPPTTDSYQFADLSVAMQDGVNGVPKFLVLVEIFSRGKTIEQAKAKFMKELIYVLQCQSDVFGLFCTNTTFCLYHAKKEQGEISIANDTYHLLQYVSSKGSILHVAEFQRLIIDILTCLAFGVQNIAA